MSNEENTIRLKILRYDPESDAAPHQETYSVPVAEEKMSLLQALEAIYQQQDEPIAFRRYCCGVQFCNSCLMLVNGKPAHACLTMVKAGEELEVAPLKGKRVLRDLIVKDGD